MKIAITGGGGFQGSHLAESLLSSGHDVTVFNTYSDNARRNLAASLGQINLVWGSVTDPECVRKTLRGHDVVFHLAAHINVDESLKDPLGCYHANILGTHNVLEAARESGVRVILSSTCEVYGDGHNIGNGESLAENAEMRPNSPYAASKAAADRIAYAYASSYGSDISIVRPFNVYGERQKSGVYGALIAIFVARALRGEALTIFGSGDATRDFSHVSDIVNGYRLVLGTDFRGRAVNFASGVNTSVKEIAEYIARKLNVAITHKPPRPGEVMRFPANISLAQKMGYTTKVGIWDGIDRYIEWAKKQ